MKRSVESPLFTLVIPAYNAESTIGRCITSIRSQSFKKFEVIIVNDGSLDATVEKAKSTFIHDERFKLIDQNNSGVSKARNAGMASARGDFIIFVDSDDTIEPDMLSELAKLVDTKAEYGFLMCGIVQRSKKKDTYFVEDFDNVGDIALLTQDIPKLISSKQLLAPWGKAYSRKTIERYKIGFQSGYSIGEDLTFNLDFLSHVQSYATTQYIGYVYYIDSLGSLSKKVDDNTFKSYDELFARNLLFCSELQLGHGAKAAFANYYLSSVYYGLGCMVESRDKVSSALAGINPSLLSQAAKMSAGAGLLGVCMSLPIILKNQRMLIAFVRLRRKLKRAMR